jgi:hypothetical protein
MNRERIFQFSVLIWQTYDLPRDLLLLIVKANERFSPQHRAAALRHVVMDAPLSVTGGGPFAERRRRVRRHYGI